MPVVTVAPNDALGKLKSNMQEVRARAVCSRWPTPTPTSKGRWPERDPHAFEHYGALARCCIVVPLQLLATITPARGDGCGQAS